MKLDKEQFIQDLEAWHESHLDYYANFVERIKEDGHKGLSDIMNVMSEFYPNAQSQIHDGMNNPSNDLSVSLLSCHKSYAMVNIMISPPPIMMK